MILRRLATALFNQNWGVVIAEVLIVIFGVYIGIWLGNWNETRGQRADAEASLADIESSMGRVLISIGERRALEPCRAALIPKLAALLTENGQEWPGAGGDASDTEGDTIGHWQNVPIPIRSWESTAWNTAITTGAAAHFDDRTFDRYADIFDGISHIRSWQEAELRLLGRLGHLNYAGPISPTDRRTALADLMELDMLSWYIAAASQQLQDFILEVPMTRPAAITPEQFEADLQVFEDLFTFVGDCMDETAYAPAVELRRRLVEEASP